MSDAPRRVYVTPKKTNSVPGRKDANGAYLKDEPVEPFRLESFLFDKQLKFVTDPRPFKLAVCSRRAGKCRPSGTLVKTPTGSRPIETLKPGDSVYGYNLDGTVSITKVTALHNQGVKEVVDLCWNKEVYASSTEDHKWLAHNTHRGIRKVKPLKEFKARDRIATEYSPIPGGSVDVKTAYSLGAFLGDGCSTCCGLQISSSDTEILDAISVELDLPYVHSDQANYSYTFLGADKNKIANYRTWCDKKRAHEKTCDLETIRTWNRKSQLNFLAGLIDTDGSVGVYSGRLTIRLAMQAKPIVDAVEQLLLDLFQVKARRTVDDREKYKNGFVYQVSVGRNMDSKRILKELPTKVPRKQWKPEYADLKERNTSKDYLGFTIKNKRLEQCWDITIDNDSHLFLDASGMIGHNTVACAAHLIDTALKSNDVLCLYITLSRANAKKLVWREMQKINNVHKLCGVEDQTELSMAFPNGSIIYLSGAKDASEIEKFRGMAIKLVYIDECQSFREYIRDLIEDVLDAALMDYDGTLCLIGTPGAIAAGYFAECAGVVQGKEEQAGAWAHHHWTFFDNPHIAIKSGKTHQQALDRVLKRRGVTVDDSTIQREFFGKWVNDTETLWVKYDTEKDHFVELPKNKKFNYIMGIDLGYTDSDAIAVLAWSDDSPVTYLIHEEVVPKQGITELVESIKSLQAKYPIMKMVIDEGGLGKKIAEELRRRHAIPVQPADKARKQENVAFLNDALRTGRFRAKSDSKFAQDSRLVEIDKDKSRPDKIAISDRYHSDIIDAVLYAFKESPAYAFEEAPAPLQVGSSEWAKEEEKRMFDLDYKLMQEQAERDKYGSEY